jgi:integrase
MLARGIRTDKLFFSCHGDFLHPSALRGKLSRIDPKLHPHIFRHTHVALLAERGASLETISRRLGHSDSKITRDVYFHVTERMKEQDESFLETVSFL